MSSEPRDAPGPPASTADLGGGAAEQAGREFVRRFYELGESTFETTRWFGVRARKMPLDLWMLQEIVFETKPDLIVEAGVHEGGSTLFFANLLDLLGRGEVIAIDPDLSCVDERVGLHPRITLVQGTSTDDDVLARIRAAADGRRVMVDLDSDHAAVNVLEELRRLAGLVTPGCYLVVEDTVVNGNPVEEAHGPGPAEALARWLEDKPPFELDPSRERLLASFNTGGYLRRSGEGAPPTAAAAAGPLLGGAEAELLRRRRLESETEALRSALAARTAEIKSMQAATARSSRRFRELEDELARQVELAGRLRWRISELERDRDEADGPSVRAELAEREQRLQEATLRLERIQQALPMRFLARIRRLPLLRRVFARRAEDYWAELGRRRQG